MMIWVSQLNCRKMADYKRLGDYIVAVDERNSDLSITLSQGINNNKYFQQPRQVAENSKNDKIVRHGYFAYNRATTRNGDKISIAYREGEDCTVSSAYQVFYIKDEELLNPHYLLLWFKRPTFDRYARFKSHGSAHEFFEWEEMCNVMLPVPPIEEQRHIVEQYQTVERRIKNKERLIALLEDTAQTIFRHRFVENIDPNNLPEGWRMGTLGEIADFSYGKLPSKEENGDVPVFSGYAVVGMTNVEMFNEQHIVVIARGDSGSGKIVLSPHRFFLTNLAISINLHDNAYMHYLYQHLLSADTYSLRSGSAQAQVTINDLAKFEVMIPSNKEVEAFQTLVLSLYRYKETIEKENNLLNSTKEALICKL